VFTFRITELLWSRGVVDGPIRCIRQLGTLGATNVYIVLSLQREWLRWALSRPVMRFAVPLKALVAKQQHAFPNPLHFINDDKLTALLRSCPSGWRMYPQRAGRGVRFLRAHTLCVPAGVAAATKPSAVIFKRDAGERYLRVWRLNAVAIRAGSRRRGFPPPHKCDEQLSTESSARTRYRERRESSQCMKTCL